jgi:DNA-binding response OmpR family regulator
MGGADQGERCFGRLVADKKKDVYVKTTKRVLVVEDEVLIRMLAVDMLLEFGYQSDEAGNAAEALKQLQMPGADYGLVFLDIGLPDKRGDDLIKEIRASHSDLPLLVASGEDQVALKSRLGGFAPIAFLGKPYDSHHFREQLAILSAIAERGARLEPSQHSG